VVAIELAVTDALLFLVTVVGVIVYGALGAAAITLVEP
jgi:hypothetical protein